MRKMNLFKKALAVLTALSMTAAIAGCGDSGSQGGSSSDTQQSKQEQSGAENESSGDASASGDDLYGEEVTISVMVWDRGNARPGTTTEDNGTTRWIQEQVKEKFNINVEFLAVPRSESDNKINIMMGGGSAPDIIYTYDQALFYRFAVEGGLHELTEVYEKYGSDIEEFCGSAQAVGYVGDEKYAVMRQKGTEAARHMTYIRKDWLDELNMEIPTTKEELEKYLYAVKANNLGGDKTIPWAMNGRDNTERMYLNFLGSYVAFDGDREAYIYSEGYVAVHPDAKEGLRKLNQYYNDGLITKDFATDAADDSQLNADLANGNVGFVLSDVSQPWDSIHILNKNLGHETFVPVQCFDLPDGSYRSVYEPRHAMFVMVPKTTSEEKLAACMKFLNWMADPEVGVDIQFTDAHTYDQYGVAVGLTAEELDEGGYAGTPSDLCLVNVNFPWVNDYELLAKINYEGQVEADDVWASQEWVQSYYDTQAIGKFRYPIYAFTPEAETQYGSDVKNRMIGFVYRVISCPSDQFEALYDAEYAEMVNAGLQKILDGRAEYYDSLNH